MLPRGAEPALNSTLRRVLAGATNTRAAGLPRKLPVGYLDKDPRAKHFSRTEIVSEKLCDDIIAYLAPTLKQYQGCTILDVHPGACLWSRKLHEFLQPKCHILMEPDDRYTADFIQPLLQKEHSRYRHFPQPFLNPTTGNYAHPYAQALEFARHSGSGSGSGGGAAAADDLRDIPTLSTSTRSYDDHRLRLVDSRLLMTGNLARIYPRRPPTAILSREVLAALDNTSIHRNGLVRQLFWIPDDPKHKVAICPHVISGRTSGNLLLALAADITEVAGTQLTAKVSKGRDSISLSRSRSTYLTADQKWEVEARMATAGIRVPKGRKLLQHSTPPQTGTGELIANFRDPFRITHHTVEDVSHAIEQFSQYLSTLRAISPDWSKVPSGNNILEPLLRNLAYPQSLPSAFESIAPTLRRTGDDDPHITNLTQRKAIYLDTMLRLINLETAVVALRDDSPENLDITPLQLRLHDLETEISGPLMGSLVASSVTVLEDQLLHFSHPKNLMYDRRPFDPLLCSPKEFWPPSSSGLALYDCMPSPVDLDVEGIAPRSQVLKLARELAKLLYPLKGSPLPTALDRVAPNAAQDLIPKTKEVTDPRRGGRLDAGKVVTRMVSEGMFEGLLRSWWEWPFRPETWELEVEGSVGTKGPGGER